jgi:hypothetical protein
MVRLIQSCLSLFLEKSMYFMHLRGQDIVRCSIYILINKLNIAVSGT